MRDDHDGALAAQARDGAQHALLRSGVERGGGLVEQQHRQARRERARHRDPLALATAGALLDGLDLVPLSTHLLSDAADVGSDTLRTLDAIHLASALSLGDALTSLVVYDRRLTEAAAAAGIEVVSPGANLPQV